jgi:predicted phosphodiesterase
MRTAVVSDLHLATRTERDLLRRPAARELLFRALEGVDRLLLLGDVIELRESPIATALEEATPFFAELGEAFAGREVVMLAGNHDYQLAAPVLEARQLGDEGAGLELEETMDPPPTGPTAHVATALGEARLVLAYPGVWLRPDVYATHGHYMDFHGTVPTLERIAIGLTARVIRDSRRDGRTPDDYEAALAPVYALTYALAQAPSPARLTGAGTSVKMWQTLSGEGAGRRIAALALGGLALPAGVAALNRAGIGPLSANLSGEELRRAGLRAMGAVVQHLGIEADHVLFGHTHRSGPWPYDDDDGWALPGGTRLVNTGSWLYEPAFVGPPSKPGPYWPGTCAFVDDEGPPRLENLLDEIPDA